MKCLSSCSHTSKHNTVDMIDLRGPQQNMGEQDIVCRESQFSLITNAKILTLKVNQQMAKN